MAKTFIHQLCEDTGYHFKDLSEVMDNKDRCQERVKGISAVGTTMMMVMIEMPFPEKEKVFLAMQYPICERIL